MHLLTKIEQYSILTLPKHVVYTSIGMVVNVTNTYKSKFTANISDKNLEISVQDENKDNSSNNLIPSNDKKVTIQNSSINNIITLLAFVLSATGDNHIVRDLISNTINTSSWQILLHVNKKIIFIICYTWYFFRFLSYIPSVICTIFSNQLFVHQSHPNREKSPSIH